MALVIPNATDTTGGLKYAALDQAEPDALDFEILGYGGSGVLNGCVVTSNSNNTNVAVSAGVVILNGIPYPVVANATLAVPTSPADNRFDLVVARVTGSTAALVVIQGTNSATNPAYPKSMSVVLTAFSATTNIDPATDVTLAAVYRSGATVITASRIVDKRTIRTVSVFDQGIADPSPAYGSTGYLYYKTGAPNGVSSGLFIKTSTGNWVELSQNVGSHLPIGAAFAWPTSAPAPTGCLEADGGSYAVATYPALFGVYGYQHGGAGAMFNVPNYNERYLRGTTSTALVNTTLGNDSMTLLTTHLPVHSHGVVHTHGFGHSHGIDHDHPGGTTASNAGAYSSSNELSSPRMKINPSSWFAYGHHWKNIVDNGGWRTSGAPGVLFGDLSGVSRISGDIGTDDALWAAQQYEMADMASHSHTISGGTHSHTYDVPAYTGSTTSQSVSTTLPGSTVNTDNTGSGTLFDLKPSSRYTRWMIRASLGSDPSFTGYTNSVENITIEVIPAVTALTIGDGKKYIKLPATMDGMNLVSATASVFARSTAGIPTVQIARGRQATSTTAHAYVDVLSTLLTIDVNEYDSKDGVAAPVINLANDDVLNGDMIRIDLDVAGTGATGLFIVLGFRRP